MKKFNNKKVKIIILIIIIGVIFGIIFINTSKQDIETVKDSVVMIETFDENDELLSTGSGFCAYKENYIITNFHVIQGAKKIKIIDDNKNEYDVQKIELFISSDDLAILSGNFSFKPIQIDKSVLKAGDKCTAIGSPQGELNTVSNGIISNADDDFQIRITAPISPGSSGGVLLNDKNKIIGITYARYNSLEAQNINYAIKVSYLDKVYEYLRDEKAFPLPNKTMYSSLDSFTNSGANYVHIYYYVDNMESFYKATSKKVLFEEALKEEDSNWYNEFIKLKEEEKNKCVAILDDFQEEYREKTNKQSGKIVNISEIIKTYSKEEILYNLFIKKYQYAIILARLNESNYTNETINSLPLENGIKIFIKYALIYGDIGKLSNDENKEFTNYIMKDKYSTNSDVAISLFEYMGYKVEKDANTYSVYWN